MLLRPSPDHPGLVFLLLSLPSPGNQRSSPSSQRDTLLYLEKLFSGSGTAAVPPGQSEPRVWAAPGESLAAL